jgi:hypothetical protein
MFPACGCSQDCEVGKAISSRDVCDDLHASQVKHVIFGMYKVIVLFAAFLSITVDLRGETKTAPQFRIQIRMRESKNQSAPKDSTYALLLQAESKGTINASYRIPYYSSTKGEAKELHTVALGSIFDCVARDAEGGVRLDCGFESSHVSKRQQSVPPIGFPPMIQSRQAHTTAVIPFGAEVPMAELDDPTSGDRLQFFVSAERFNASGSNKANQ